jgi:hypothetical protein
MTYQTTMGEERDTQKYKNAETNNQTNKKISSSPFEYNTQELMILEE